MTVEVNLNSMSDDLDDLFTELGVDYSDERDRLARDLVEADRELLRQLIQVRVLAGMSKSDVADAMGRHRSVVTNFEKMTSDPHLSTIRRYAAAVGALVTHRVEHSVPSAFRFRIHEEVSAQLSEAVEQMFLDFRRSAANLDSASASTVGVYLSGGRERFVSSESWGTWARQTSDSFSENDSERSGDAEDQRCRT